MDQSKSDLKRKQCSVGLLLTLDRKLLYSEYWERLILKQKLTFLSEDLSDHLFVCLFYFILCLYIVFIRGVLIQSFHAVFVVSSPVSTEIYVSDGEDDAQKQQIR